MKAYLKIYLNDRGFSKEDFIPCEVCGAKASEVHHVVARGMGSSKYRDIPDNLIALCRPCHHEADFGTKLPKEYLRQIVNDNREKIRPSAED